jgi:PLAC8 family
MREKYNIDGSVGEDCLGAFFCRCCGLVQEEKEVVLRQQNGGAAGYQAPQGMDYKP